jgi:hypothetical protein
MKAKIWIALTLFFVLIACQGQGKISTAVTKIEVSPSSASIQIDASQVFTAVAKNADGQVISGINFTWNTSDTAKASLVSSGTFKGMLEGSTEITASASGVVSNKAALTVVAKVTSFAPNPTLQAIPANTALDLGVYECSQPVSDPGYCESITDYSGMAYDSSRHHLLMFGGGHAATFRDDVDVFSFATLKWGSAYPSTPCDDMTSSNVDDTHGRWISSNHPFARHTYDMLIFAENTKELLLLSPNIAAGNCTPANDPFYKGSTIAAFDPSLKTWNFSDVSAEWSLASAEYDPISKLVVIVSQNGLWTYDPVTHTATKQLEQEQVPGDRMGYGNNLVYYPPNQRLYYIARESPTRVFEVKLERSDLTKSSVTELSTMSGEIPDSGESAWIYDASHQRIGGGIKDGMFYAFNPSNNNWTKRVMIAQSSSSNTVGRLAFHAMAYDPVDQVFLFISDYDSGRHVWAYRYDGN